MSMLSNPAYREMYMQTMQNPQTRQMMLQMMRNPAFMQQMMQTLPPGMRQSLGDNPENLERMVRERERERERERVLCSIFLVLMTSGTIRDC